MPDKPVIDIQKVTPEMVLKNLFLNQYKKGYFSVNPVYDHFNDYLKEHCNIDPKTFTNGLKAEGLIETSGRRSKTGSKSIIMWLTEKGQAHFGIRAPKKVDVTVVAGAKGESKPVTKLLKATAERFNCIKD